ncbi:hypothetical protein DLH72_03620 [Candidatus Gracilibacteria bacterium]|nr:MAG: hypothetical protein DLH72_03620 [Candidatus Gracilibacteria bacterium]
MKNCPNCGRPITFEEKYTKVLACPYCNSILEFGEGELTKIGEQGYFIEFPSQFEVGKNINFAGKDIYIKGQLRFEYDGGFFDEFFVEIEGKGYYLREDDGQISFLDEAKTEKSEVSLVDKIAGENFEYKGQKFYIEEVGIFKLVNLKGFIATKLTIGKEYEYLIGIFQGKKYIFEKESGNNFLRIIREIKSFNK